MNQFDSEKEYTEEDRHSGKRGGGGNPNYTLNFSEQQTIPEQANEESPKLLEARGGILDKHSEHSATLQVK